MRREPEAEQLQLDGAGAFVSMPRGRNQNRYCYLHRTHQLTKDEERDSQIVGHLPRCRECLEQVGMPGR